MIKVMSVFGTRPEAIKMCPLVKEMERDPRIDSVVCLTGQHREMLLPMLDVFGVHAEYNLNIMQKKQNLYTITAGVLTDMQPVLETEQPDIVLVHGDTTTAFSAALAAYYQKVDVGHVEAGLRTYNKYAPFPEEMNRELISRIARLHFAPTNQNAQNLKREGLTANVYVTGNTVIDSFRTTVREKHRFENGDLAQIDFSVGRTILVTAHRRENLGKPLKDICQAILEIVKAFPDTRVIYPVHLNPVVRETVFQVLGGQDRIFLIDPVNVLDMHNLISRSTLILTDSGGLQEEAPHFGIPVLVLREETEREEAIKAGVAKLVGTDRKAIVETVQMLLTDSEAYSCMSQGANPFGDGYASRRIINAITEIYG